MREDRVEKQQTRVPPACTLEETSLLRDRMVLERLRRNHGIEENHPFLIAEALVNLLRTYGVLTESINQSLAPYGLTLAKYNLLLVLHGTAEHQLRMSEIGERMSVTCANITKLIDGLELEGLVRRQSLPGDRRVVLAQLTPEGIAAVLRLMPIQLDAISRLWSALDEQDCRLMTHLLTKLRASILHADPTHHEKREEGAPAAGNAV